MSSGLVRLRYRRPFGGRGTPLEPSGLFLFDPETELRVLGTSLRGLIQGEKHASLWSSVQRNIRLDIQPTEALQKKLLSLIPEAAYKHDLAAALKGDKNAGSRLIAIGPWELSALAIAAATPDRPRGYTLNFLVGIEQASVLPSALIRLGHCSEASALLAKDPLLKAFLWPRALDVLKRCEDPNFLLSWKTSVAMEVRLSMLAAMDPYLQTSSRQMSCPQALLSSLLPIPDDARSTPVRRLFQWLMQTMRAKTIPQLKGKLLQKRVVVDLVTLKQWSNGAHQPGLKLARDIANALPSKEKKDEFVKLCSGCRQLHFLGYLAQMECEGARKHAGRATAVNFDPWPELPFGYESFEAWCVGRYPVWLDFHRRRLAELQSQEAA